MQETLRHINTDTGNSFQLRVGAYAPSGNAARLKSGALVENQAELLHSPVFTPFFTVADVLAAKSVANPNVTRAHPKSLLRFVLFFESMTTPVSLC